MADALYAPPSSSSSSPSHAPPPTNPLPRPLRIKQSIRDTITHPVGPSALQSQSLKVTSTLGYPLIFEPQWPMLWNALSAHFPDLGRFAPWVADMVVQWCRGLVSWLENAEPGLERSEESVERLLEELRGCRGLELVLEISQEIPTSRPKTYWRPQSHSFVIVISKGTPSSPLNMYWDFCDDFKNLSYQNIGNLIIPDPSATPATTAMDADWSSDSLSVEESHFYTNGGVLPSPLNRNPASRERGTGAIPTEPESILPEEPLPGIFNLERPEELMNRPPYRIFVRQESKMKIEVQGSHQGSLKVLEGYLRRWVRTGIDFEERPPLAAINLRESIFGRGLLFDTLIIEASPGKETNVLLILALVENALGYQAAGNGGGNGVWEFIRLRRFC